MDINEKLCACFLVWQKTFDGIKWTKLTQTLKATAFNWRKRILISELYMN
jgi:hypothetical protein